MTVKRFRTKIVEIEAMQWRYNSTLFEKMRDWTEGNFRLIDERKSEDEFIDHFTAQVYDKLHDTWISVADGQWIVRGAKGEFYPCDDETFHWKYEEVIETHEPDGTVAQFPAKVEGIHPFVSPNEVRRRYGLEER
jgi:hypothetical protein